MKRRFIMNVALALAVGACSDQQEPVTGSDPGELAATVGTKPINVVTKTPVTASQLAELAKYGSVLKEIRQIRAVIMTGAQSSLASIQKLRFVEAANFDAERNIPPEQMVELTDFTSGLSTWNLDAVDVTQRTSPRSFHERTATMTGDGIYVAILDTGLLPTWQAYFPDERIATQYARSFGGGGNDRGAISEQPNKWEQDTHSHGTHVTSTVIGYDFVALRSMV